MASSLPLNTEEQRLLPEIWHHIWSFVDFETLQKSCVAVSKTWFNGIRDSPTLSSEMKIKKGKGTSINYVVSAGGRGVSPKTI